MKPKVLIIDDEKSIRDIFTLLLEEKGYAVEAAETGKAGVARARAFRPDAVLLDMNLPDMSGMEAIPRIKEAGPGVEIVIITAFGTIRNAVEATKLGAYAYLEKPVDNEELLLTLSRLVEVKALAREVETLRSELTERYAFSNIIGTGARMNSVFQTMARVARVDGTVLITGESGTGKELVAKAIHYEGPRKNNPFVVVNCGAVPRELIESEFFGHAKGAFTDAKEEKTGKFEMAHTGTIFLDEVGELSAEAQVKLLRALGEREIVKVGGTKTIPVDVRVIAATNKDLEQAVREGMFREDLYWRLAVLSLHLPPLRERREDIPLLCDHFIRKYRDQLEKDILGLAPEALELMTVYPWPGNVRELESVIYEAIVLSDAAEIEAAALPSRLRRGQRDAADGTSAGKTLGEIVADVSGQVERRMIEKTLEATGGNRTRAAALLGISRKTLFNKMRELGIDRIS
ncbi:sigma-54-dependent Fis family transcriptional regulator [bacterium]|nr:MAG: sigma-54-dependent Fis family transcriptional regulator [bacterium]